MNTLAIVPIFTSAGAALLPTIVACVISGVAIVFRPRELLRLGRERPIIVSTSLGALALVLVVILWCFRPATPARSATAHIDWVRVAEQILAHEKAGKAPPLRANNARPDEALVLGRDYSRCSFGGGTSPVQLKRLWSFQPEDTLFLSSPVVSGKRVYAAACQSDLGGYTGLLACLDAETGKPLWQKTEAAGETLRPFFSSPALTRDSKYLVVGQGLHADKNCSLLCFEAMTGRLHWAVKTSLHIESSPAILGDVAVVGAGAIEGPGGKPVGDPGFVLAVRISDGKELWRQAVNDPESSPAIDRDGMVLIGSGFNGNAIVALRSDPEEQLRTQNRDRIAWRTALQQPVTCPITLAGDLVLAGAGNSDIVHSHPNAQGWVVALERKTGALRWQREFADAVLGAVACRDGKVICPSRTGEVTALAAQDGTILWRSRVSENAPVLAGCTFTGRRIYAVSNDGYLAVLDPANGKVLEKIYLNSQAKPGSGLALSAPQAVDGRVYVGSETGGLLCLVGSGSVE